MAAPAASKCNPATRTKSPIIFVVMIMLASPISTLMQAPKEALGLTATL